MRVAINVAVGGILRSRDAFRLVELGFRRRHADAVFRIVPGESRKRPGSARVSGVRTRERRYLSESLIQNLA